MLAVNEKNLSEVARAERLEYFKQWRAANKDKVKKHNQDYWRKRAEKKLREGQNDT
jgi:hypothetical protein